MVCARRNPWDSPSRHVLAMDAPLAELVDHRGRLRGRHHRVVEALEDEHRAVDLGDPVMGERRSYSSCASGSGPISPSV